MNSDFNQFLEQLDKIIEELENEIETANNDNEKINELMERFVFELQLIPKINSKNKSKKQRSRMIRKNNNNLSKRLLNFSKICSNQEINKFYNKIHNEWKLMKEQEEIDGNDLKDACMLLKEHDKKKELLISEFEKITSIVNYRRILMKNSDNKLASNIEEDDFEVNIKKLKELISRKIRRINREQAIIKNLFNFDKLKMKQISANNEELIEGTKEIGKIQNNYLAVNISKYIKNNSLSIIDQAMDQPL